MGELERKARFGDADRDAAADGMEAVEHRARQEYGLDDGLLVVDGDAGAADSLPLRLHRGSVDARVLRQRPRVEVLEERRPSSGGEEGCEGLPCRSGVVVNLRPYRTDQ